MPALLPEAFLGTRRAVKPSPGLGCKGVLQPDQSAVPATSPSDHTEIQNTRALYFPPAGRGYLSPRPVTSLLQTVSIRINLSRKESGENALIKQLYSCRKAASMSILNYLGTPSGFAFPWHSFALAHKASSAPYFHLSEEQKRLTAQHHLPCLGASALPQGFCVRLCRNLAPARCRDRKFGFFYKTKDQGKKRPSRNKGGGAVPAGG